MKKNINVEVNSIRLEENTETPIMLLLDPNSQKVLPIWIGTIEAVSIAEYISINSNKLSIVIF